MLFLCCLFVLCIFNLLKKKPSTSKHITGSVPVPYLEELDAVIYELLLLAFVVISFEEVNLHG